MEVSLLDWIAAFGFLAIMAVVFLSVCSICQNKLHTESIVATCIGAINLIFLGIIGEVYALNIIPIKEPLRYLPICTLCIFAILSIYVLRKYGLASVIHQIHRIVLALRGFHPKQSKLTFTLAVILLFFSITYLLFGMFLTPAGWDTLAYHLPLAIQPYQDGSLQNIPSPISWINFYPRGIETIWYWTLQILGSDLLFNVVQLFFGLQLLLAIYQLGKRIGLSFQNSFLASFILGATPLYFILTTSGYIDIAYNACIVGILSWLVAGEKSEQLKTNIFLPLLHFH